MYPIGKLPVVVVANAVGLSWDTKNLEVVPHYLFEGAAAIVCALATLFSHVYENGGRRL